MHQLSSCRWSLALLAIVFLVGSVRADESAADFKYNGPASCSAVACHGSMKAVNDGRTVHNEHTLWTAKDRHARAYASLTTEYATQIAKGMNLGAAPTESDRCLQCHTLNVPPELRGPTFSMKAGNSCDNCHGPSEKWLVGHAKASAQTKSWTRRQSLDAGMNDTLDMAVRAATCVHCHLAIDHQMVAAGHPTMMFELDSASARLPPHWIREAPYAMTRAWAAGQLVCLRDALKQLRHRIMARAPEKYIVEASVTCLAYYTTSHMIASLIAPDDFRPISEELDWLATGQNATPEKIDRAAAEDFQMKIYDLAGRVGTQPFDAVTNRKLIKSMLGSDSMVEETGLKTATLVFCGLDALCRPLVAEMPEAQRKPVFESLGNLQKSLVVADGKQWTADAFLAALESLRKAFP